MSRTTFVSALAIGKPKAKTRGPQVETTGITVVAIDSPYPDDATMAAIRKVRSPKLKKITQSPF